MNTTCTQVKGIFKTFWKWDASKCFIILKERRSNQFERSVIELYDVFECTWVWRFIILSRCPETVACINVQFFIIFHHAFSHFSAEKNDKHTQTCIHACTHTHKGQIQTDLACNRNILWLAYYAHNYSNEKILWTPLWNFNSWYKQRTECIRFMKLGKKIETSYSQNAHDYVYGGIPEE